MVYNDNIKRHIVINFVFRHADEHLCMVISILDTLKMYCLSNNELAFSFILIYLHIIALM